MTTLSNSNHLLKDGTLLTVREAMVSDTGSLIKYVKQVADETNYLTFDSSEFNKTISQEAEIIQASLDSPNHLFLVALLEEQIIGILTLGGSHKRRLRHVVDFGVSVLKDHWGKGVGNHLIQTMISWGQNNPVVKKISLKVQCANHAAISLYEKYGFEQEGLIKRDFFIDDQYMDTYLMALWVGEESEQ